MTTLEEAVFQFGPYAGKKECYYHHVPVCADDPRCTRSSCGLAHPARESQAVQWQWVWPLYWFPQDPPPHPPAERVHQKIFWENQLKDHQAFDSWGWNLSDQIPIDTPTPQVAPSEVSVPLPFQEPIVEELPTKPPSKSPPSPHPDHMETKSFSSSLESKKVLFMSDDESSSPELKFTLRGGRAESSYDRRSMPENNPVVDPSKEIPTTFWSKFLLLLAAILAFFVAVVDATMEGTGACFSHLGSFFSSSKQRSRRKLRERRSTYKKRS